MLFFWSPDKSTSTPLSPTDEKKIDTLIKQGILSIILFTISTPLCSAFQTDIRKGYAGCKWYFMKQYFETALTTLNQVQKMGFVTKFCLKLLICSIKWIKFLSFFCSCLRNAISIHKWEFVITGLPSFFINILTNHSNKLWQ